MAEAGVTAAGRRAVSAAAAGAALCLVVLAIVGSQPGSGRSELAPAASPVPAAAKSSGEAVSTGVAGATVASASSIPEAPLPGSEEAGSQAAPLPGSGEALFKAAGATVASAAVPLPGAAGAGAAKTSGGAGVAAVKAAAQKAAAQKAGADAALQLAGSYAAVEARASREAAAAKKESKEVLELKAELTHLKRTNLAEAATPTTLGGQATHGAVATKQGVLARTHKLNGVTDMRNGGSNGAGYWDAEHKDDDWQPVADVVSGLNSEAVENTRLLGSRQQLRGPTTGDDHFSDDASASGALAAASNKAVASNREQEEFKRDDHFVAPPAELTPNHRLPLETQDAGWETALGDTVGALWKGNAR